MVSQFLLSIFRTKPPSQDTPSSHPHCPSMGPSIKKSPPLPFQSLLQGSIIRIGPRYWTYNTSVPQQGHFSRIFRGFKLLLGERNTHLVPEKKNELSMILAPEESLSVYLRIVLVGKHRALVKARSQAQMPQGPSMGTIEWHKTHAFELVVPEAATNYATKDLSLVVEAFRKGATGEKDSMLARGVVHNFMDHLRRAQGQRILVVQMVPTRSQILAKAKTVITSRPEVQENLQNTVSEASFRLAYLPYSPHRHHCSLDDDVLPEKNSQKESNESNERRMEWRSLKSGEVRKKVGEVKTATSEPPTALAGTWGEESVMVANKIPAVELLQPFRSKKSDDSNFQPTKKNVRQRTNTKDLEQLSGPRETTSYSTPICIHKHLDDGGLINRVQVEDTRENLREMDPKGNSRSPLNDVEDRKERVTPQATASHDKTRLPRNRKAAASAARRRAQLSRVNRMLADLERLPQSIENTEGGQLDS